MIELYTVEFDEYRAGQTKDGVDNFWFKVIEPFRVGHFDDALMRAQKRAISLWHKAVYRNVTVIPWERQDKELREFDSKYPARTIL